MMGITLYRPSLRAWGAIAVLTAWVASLAWLGARELGQDESSTVANQASLRLGPGEAWFGLYAGTVQVGSAGITLDTLSPGYRILETVILELPTDSGPIRATRLTETRLAGTLELTSIDSRYSRPGRQAGWYLTPRGDTLVARYSVGAGSSGGIRGTAVFDGPLTPVAAFPYRLALSGGLTEGNRSTPTMVAGWPPVGRSALAVVGIDSTIRFADSSVADGSTGRLVAARYDSVKAFPVVIDGPAGPARVWIDRRGSIAGIETVFGVRWQRNDFGLAVQQFRRDLPEATSRVEDALAGLTSLISHPDADSGVGDRRFVVEHRDGSPIDRSLLALLAGGRQAVRGDTIFVRPEAFATQAGGFDTLPRDPMIQTEARQIVRLGTRLRSKGATRLLLNELSDTLRRLVRIDTSATAALDAAGALKEGRAGPDGFVRLYVSILQAAQVPARMVIGVAPAGDGLRTHAWAEVREAGGSGWLAVDPLLGRVPASTSLIRLAYGGSSHPEDMLMLLADVKFIDLDSSENRQ